MNNKKYKFTSAAQYVMERSAFYANQRLADTIELGHVFIALFTSHVGTAYEILADSGISYSNLVEKLGGFIEIRLHNENRKVKDKKYSPRVESALENAALLCKATRHTEIGTVHLLMAVLREMELVAGGTKFDIPSRDITVKCGIALGMTESLARKKFENGFSMKTPAGSSILEKYCINISRMAELGELDPVIGRDVEILRVMQTLSRRTKNNACLVGEPGVGKTAIVEGLAQLIASGRVPDVMKNKKLYNVQMSRLVSGTRFRGDFEERLKDLINEVKRDSDIVLFIDELHSIIGAGGSEGTNDASNILKPALSRGEIRVIGATTLTEYRKYIEKDAALERRFQPVTVDEPDKKLTLDILKGLRGKFEEFHNVTYTDQALESAVELSSRYVNDRFLPDKAIDVIDEAAAFKRLKSCDSLHAIKSNENADLSAELERALADGMTVEAEYIYKKLNKASKKNSEVKEEKTLEIDTDDIAEVVSQWTRIPVSRLTVSEQKRLLKLSDELHKRVVGQDEAVEAVSKAVKRSRVGLKDPKRPVGSFLFLGPTGVGKTELSKALAETLFGDEKSMIRVDMSEYMEKHSVSKFIGSPPGYVGFDEGGQLADRVRTNPYSVILFDEIEKAHPDVFNIMLQVLDDGIITDSKGRKVDFKNTIIIMTSNLGADKIVEPKRLGFTPGEESAEASHKLMMDNVMDEVKRLFRPEFLNRLDDIIVFRELTEAQISQIAGMLLDQLKKRVHDDMNINIRYSAKLKNFICTKGYDPKFGARPLKRTVQTYVEDTLSDEILSGHIKSGDTVTLSVSKVKAQDTGIEEDKVTIKVKEKNI